MDNGTLILLGILLVILDVLAIRIFIADMRHRMHFRKRNRIKKYDERC